MTSFKRHFPHFGSKHHSKCEDSLDGGSNELRHQQKPSRRSKTEIQRENHFNQIAFKEDISNCAALCSDYIQSLNALCGSGNALAQQLIKVFSRDVSSLLADGKYGEKDNLFAPYFGLTEDFLRVWESLSVATASASALLKTDTLISVHDLVNKLEPVGTSKSKHKKSAEERMKDQIRTKESLRATRNCLLSYVELQAQFAYASWTSLNALSIALNNDPTMGGGILDNVQNAFSHKESIDNVDYLLTSTQVGQSSQGPPSSHVVNPVTLHSAPTAVSRYSLDSSVGTSEDSDSFGLEDAINLLSLNPPSCDRYRQQPPPEPLNYQQMPANYTSTFPDRIMNSENKPSTWPGKRSNEDYKNWELWNQQDISGRLDDPFPTWNPTLPDTSSSSSRASDGSIGFDAETEANVYEYVKGLMELQGANKRLSCSSDGINLDQNGPLNGYLAGDMLGCNNFGSHDGKTTKTSTWPLKQVSPGTLSPPPFERPFLPHDCLLSSPISTQNLGASSGILWPYLDNAKQTDFK